jgi:hypothetical protein
MSVSDHFVKLDLPFYLKLFCNCCTQHVHSSYTFYEIKNVMLCYVDYIRNFVKCVFVYII